MYTYDVFYMIIYMYLCILADCILFILTKPLFILFALYNDEYIYVEVVSPRNSPLITYYA